MHNWSIRPAYCVAVNVLFSTQDPIKSRKYAILDNVPKTCCQHNSSRVGPEPSSIGTSYKYRVTCVAGIAVQPRE